MSDVARHLARLRALLAEGRYPEVLAASAGERVAGALPEARLLRATAATRTGDVARGEREAALALERFRVRGDDDGVMRCENLLGAVAFERGDLEAAGTRFGRAQQLADLLGDRLMAARTANNLASVTHLMGNAPEARRVYREALLAYQRLGSHRGAAETYHNLALVAREEGDLPSAVLAGSHAVRHAGQVGDPGLTGLVLTGRAETALLMGDLALADEGLGRAEALARAAGDEPGLAEVERVRALRWWLAGDSSRALDAAEHARLEAARLRIALLEGECAALAARCLAVLGRREESARQAALARERFTRVGAKGHLRRLETPSAPPAPS